MRRPGWTFRAGRHSEAAPPPLAAVGVFPQYAASLPLQHVAASGGGGLSGGEDTHRLVFLFFFLFPAIYAVPALPLEVGSELIRLVSIAPRPLSQHATAAAASFKTPATHSAHGSPREVSAFVLRYYYLFFFF